LPTPTMAEIRVQIAVLQAQPVAGETGINQDPATAYGRDA
jgi:hypothetical protein